MLLNNQKFNLKKIWLLCCLCVYGIITWCEAPWNNDSLVIGVSDFMLTYNGNVKLEQLNLKSDERDEIIALYQEAGDNVEYRDSLLIAEKYAQWLWVNAFAQSNLNTLYDYDLTIENIQKTQINIKDKNQNTNAVLLEYDITEWFIESIPVLYISQLFIEHDANVVFASYITESKQSRDYASNMFKNIK